MSSVFIFAPKIVMKSCSFTFIFQPSAVVSPPNLQNTMHTWGGCRTSLVKEKSEPLFAFHCNLLSPLFYFSLRNFSLHLRNANYSRGKKNPNKKQCELKTMNPCIAFLLSQEHRECATDSSGTVLWLSEHLCLSVFSLSHVLHCRFPLMCTWPHFTWALDKYDFPWTFFFDSGFLVQVWNEVPSGSEPSPQNSIQHQFSLSLRSHMKVNWTL